MKDRIYTSSTKGDMTWGSMNPKHLRNAAAQIRRKSFDTVRHTPQMRKAFSREANEMEAFATEQEEAWKAEHPETEGSDDDAGE